MFGSLLDLTTNMTKIALAPVKVVVDVSVAVTQPLADVAEEIVDDVKEITR